MNTSAPKESVRDYFVVGCGLAGIAFCEQLKSNRKSFLVFDDDQFKSSIVAGGLFNPLNLKRYTPFLKEKAQLDSALQVYERIEEELKIDIAYKMPVLRLFHSVEEQNNWFAALDKPSLGQWMSSTIIPNKNTSINAQHGFGKVLHTGRVNAKRLITNYRKGLTRKGYMKNEKFDYRRLTFDAKHVRYKGLKAKRIVFSEGFGLKDNPLFSHLPLIGTKGELLTIYAPELKLNAILKSKIFLIPTGGDHYIVGATYNWKDKTGRITLQAKRELKEKLRKVIYCDFEIIDQEAAIRPTVIDRNPLLGVHAKYKKAFLLNGLGTRGVILAPNMAKKLYDFIEYDHPLDKKISIERFPNRG